MKISFDGLRMNLARSYNSLVQSIPNPTEEQKEAIRYLRTNIGAFLCLYDDDDKEDMNMLLDEITLYEYEDNQEANYGKN